MMNRNDKLVTAVVAGVLSEKVDAQVDFTAHDITREVRSLVGMTTLVDHADVRSLVEASFLSGKFEFYDRALDYSLGNGTPPWRYSPTSGPIPAVAILSNLNTVKNQKNPILNAMQSQSITANNSKAVPQPKTPQAAQASGTTAVVSRSGDTLRLLKDVLNKSGFHIGDRVYVTYMPSAKQIYVTSKQPRTNDANAVSRPYVVDVKQNVRVNLSQLGAEHAQSFIAVPSTGQINISVG